MKLLGGDDTDGTDDSEIEPPPMAHPNLGGFYAEDIPFGDPPDEPVTLVGKVPWELADPEAAPADE
jgi:hypothetical protein